MLEVWLPLLGLAALGSAWYHVMRLRERITAKVRRLCDERGLQLLDDSVSLERLRLVWRRGSLRVRRDYRFATSTGGNDRAEAGITVLGEFITSARLPVSAISTGPREASERSGVRSAPDAEDNVISFASARTRRTLH